MMLGPAEYGFLDSWRRESPTVSDIKNLYDGLQKLLAVNFKNHGDKINEMENMMVELKSHVVSISAALDGISKELLAISERTRELLEDLMQDGPDLEAPKAFRTTLGLLACQNDALNTIAERLERIESTLYLDLGDRHASNQEGQDNLSGNA
jgi:archaellum component FlaC